MFARKFERQREEELWRLSAPNRKALAKAEKRRIAAMSEGEFRLMLLDEVRSCGGTGYW